MCFRTLLVVRVMLIRVQGVSLLITLITTIILFDHRNSSEKQLQSRRNLPISVREWQMNPWLLRGGQAFTLQNHD